MPATRPCEGASPRELELRDHLPTAVTWRRAPAPSRLRGSRRAICDAQGYPDPTPAAQHPARVLMWTRVDLSHAHTPLNAAGPHERSSARCGLSLVGFGRCPMASEDVVDSRGREAAGRLMVPIATARAITPSHRGCRYRSTCRSPRKPAMPAQFVFAPPAACDGFPHHSAW